MEELSLYQKADNIGKLLLIKSIGSCQCLTKTPEPKYHAEDCLFRVLSEALNIIIEQQNKIIETEEIIDLVNDFVVSLSMTTGYECE